MSMRCCIVGGGIIGLSIARELAGRGHAARVVAREPWRQTASWASAGILPASRTPRSAAFRPDDALAAASFSLHRRWAEELLAETGIDNGLRQCGGLHVATSLRELRQLEREAGEWRARGVACESLDGDAVAGVEPVVGAAVAAGKVVGGLLLPEQSQLVPPRHLEALEHSCRRRGVEVTHGCEVRSVHLRHDRVTSLSITTASGDEQVEAEWFVIAAGAWTEGLIRQFGARLETRPIRGQMVLFGPGRGCPDRIIERGLEYLVPRHDRRLLVGSTMEDVGFDPSTTVSGIAGLITLARSFLPDLPEQPERTWAGLRPGSQDGLPAIGPLAGIGNCLVAAGHFRAGVLLSTGTAVLVADLVEGRAPSVDPRGFAPCRFGTPSAERMAGSSHCEVANGADESRRSAFVSEYP
jgi:glycine oxidase